MTAFYFDNQLNMLDQFMVNKNMATGDAPIKADPATARILKPPAMVNPGVYPKPIPFGGMGKPVNQNGFSDHPNHDQSHRGRLGRHGESGLSRPSVVLAWNHTRPRSGHRSTNVIASTASNFGRLRSCAACNTTPGNAWQAALALR